MIEMEIIEGLVKLFSGKKAPTDKQVHKFAEKHDIDPDMFEQEHVYPLLNALLRGVGKHNNVPDSELDRDWETN